MQRREDDVAAALLLRCEDGVGAALQQRVAAAWERREGGMGAAWWGRRWRGLLLCGGGVGAAWGRCWGSARMAWE